MTDLRDALLNQLSESALELKSEHDELAEFALSIRDDCNAWYGDTDTDYLGHVSTYVGRLEARCENLRESLKAEKASSDIAAGDLIKAIGLLREVLTYCEIGEYGAFKTSVRAFLETLDGEPS